MAGAVAVARGRHELEVVVGDKKARGPSRRVDATRLRLNLFCHLPATPFVARSVQLFENIPMVGQPCGFCESELKLREWSTLRVAVMCVSRTCRRRPSQKSPRSGCRSGPGTQQNASREGTNVTARFCRIELVALRPAEAHVPDDHAL